MAEKRYKIDKIKEVWHHLTEIEASELLRLFFIQLPLDINQILV